MVHTHKSVYSLDFLLVFMLHRVCLTARSSTVVNNYLLLCDVSFALLLRTLCLLVVLGVRGTGRRFSQFHRFGTAK